MIITSTNRFEIIAAKFREALGLAKQGYVDAIDLLNRSVERGTIVEFRVVDDQELPDVEAYWNPADRSITIRRSIYSNAAAEEVRSRFAIAHELGHALLAHPVRNRLVSGRQQFGRYVEPHETEADLLAAAILAPFAGIDTKVISTPEVMAAEFGIPLHVADRHLAMLQSRPEERQRRQTMTLKPRRIVVIDTGDCEDAFWAMSRNTERRQDE